MQNRSENEKETQETLSKFPLVSIVVLNWNGERIIRACLDSIRKLDYPNIEVIVVDNGSTDASTDIISNEFSEFCLLKNRRNLGFSAGMNVGIETSRGDLVLLFNNDAVAHPQSLSKMVRTILLKDEIGIVGGLILYSEPNDIIESCGGKLDPITGVIWAEGNGAKLNKKVKHVRNLVTDLDYISGCVFLVKKDVISKIGFFDEQVALFGQDLDWCLKARRVGFQCVLNTLALIWHIGSYSSRRAPLKNYTEKLKSDFQVVMLHFPTTPLFSSLFFQIVVAPIFEVLFSKQSDISLRLILDARMSAFCEILKNIKNIISKRKQNFVLGSLLLKPRTFELLKFIFFRAKSKEYYLGKLLQKLK